MIKRAQATVTTLRCDVCGEGTRVFSPYPDDSMVDLPDGWVLTPDAVRDPQEEALTVVLCPEHSALLATVRLFRVMHARMSEDADSSLPSA